MGSLNLQRRPRIRPLERGSFAVGLPIQMYAAILGGRPGLTVDMRSNRGFGLAAGPHAARQGLGLDARLDFGLWLACSVQSFHQLFLRSEEHTSELQSPCNLVC